ncbi:CoA-acylating methylmalonate-semialdehyde dehydrogenase [Cryobacterium sp. TMT1-66-1]|uniref:CoA-acylating methylmalonate-semialdehyde dehydrogenase n=1 Tax=Cryobacterium sp. TMT1-66-1 TaxID=1259242 RepID=UPI00106CE2F2|nr:CoA-acylating methylmalonate-semialdehyde dehydrogenase [Cryobacterium sp. TMT1-66-1]TFD07666.1 CoA-acylating methylmalonate-semialdehyde dehydrogenase [Cryobacterium sp. TMT1-66-1]
MQTIPHYINGQRVESSERFGPVFNPATGVQEKQVVLASRAVVIDAIESAQAALPEWRTSTLAKRTAIFFKVRELLAERTSELAAILTSEHGKVLSDAAGEITRGLENIEFATGLAHMLKGDFSQQVSHGIDVHSVRQAVGVVACVTPFNFPAMVPLWMIGSALACGNTVVLKPSEKDPSSAIFIAEIFTEAGLPAGVLNVVQGDKEAVDELLDNPAVKAISFVGSTPIAKSIYNRAAGNGKRVQALGGAKNHMVVLPDADLEMAADAAINAAYGSAGERCMAVSVLVAVGGIADGLVAAIKSRMTTLRVGPGTDPTSQMGPLITGEHRDRVASYLAGAEAAGATMVVDGRAQKFDSDGFFLGVSLIDHVTPGMKVYDDEIFGPVLSIVRVDTFDEAVKLVNEHEFGNGVALFTRDGGAARQFEFEIEAGMVGINVPIPVPVGSFSFGGWKNSLFGDAHMYGPDSIRFYTRGKVVTTRWPDPATSEIDLGFPQMA